MFRKRRLSLSLGFTGLVLLALAADLWLWHGPIRRFWDATRSPAAQVVARVYDAAITRGQLERALNDQLWVEGKSVASLTPEQLASARQTALEELIDYELLRFKAQANAAQLTVSEAEIDDRLARFRGCFESGQDMATAMKSQGIGRESDLRARLAARLQQEKYVESRIAPLIEVTDAEARQWFDDNASHLAIPERVEVRHLFVPTLDHPADQARAKLAAARDELAAGGGRDFATLARDLSEDPASRKHGGRLGWMTRDRLPAEFTAPVFALKPNTPTLLRTRIGWHLVEVTARQPAQPRSFEQARPEILAALEAIKRRDYSREFRSSLRRFSAPHIQLMSGL